MITIKPLEKQDLKTILEWRNNIPETLRTSFMLNEKMQEDYYNNVLSDRKGNTRYWGFWLNVPSGTIEVQEIIAMGGIENIEWENSRGEISLLVNPAYRKRGYGNKIVLLILDQAFNQMNLKTVWGEVYGCGNWGFWDKIINKMGAFKTWLPKKKYFNGQYWKALYFTFEKEIWEENYEESKVNLNT